MRSKLLTVFFSLMIMVFGFLMGVSGVFAAEYNWKYTVESPKDGLLALYGEKFKQILAEKSGGKINVEIYYYGQLGNMAQCAEMLINGVTQFDNVSSGHAAKFIPELDVFNLFFILPREIDDYKKLMQMRDAEFWKILSKKYANKNLTLLDLFTDGGMGIWTNNTKHITKLEDLKNFKMRVMTSEYLIEAYKLYGANPTPTAYGEIYSALQLNMIDGQENSINGIWDMKMYEVQKFMTYPDQFHMASSFAANREFFEALPTNIQNMINSAVQECNEYLYKVFYDYNNDCLKKIKELKPKMSFYHLTEEERAPFIKAQLPLRDRFVKSVGKDAELVLNSLLKEGAKIEKGE